MRRDLSYRPTVFFCQNVTKKYHFVQYFLGRQFEFFAFSKVYELECSESLELSIRSKLFRKIDREIDR